MRQDHFEYVPQFKLIIAGNHRPQLSGHGEAMRRRLHLVPFEVTISPEKRDPQLMSKLKSERDGILGWMVEGCAEWQRLERPLPGLPAPGAVLSPSHITLENNAKIGRIRIWRTLSRGQMADRKAAIKKSHAVARR